MFVGRHPRTLPFREEGTSSRLSFLVKSRRDVDVILFQFDGILDPWIIRTFLREIISTIQEFFGYLLLAPS